MQGHGVAHESEHTNADDLEPAHEVDSVSVSYILGLGVVVDLSLRCDQLLVSLYRTYGKTRT
jgi:hypothetical protein